MKRSHSSVEENGETVQHVRETKTKKDELGLVSAMSSSSSSSSPVTTTTTTTTTTKTKTNKTPKMMRTKKCDPQVLQVRRTIQECCKTNNLYQAIQTYQNARTSNIHMEAQTFYNLLNLCDGLRKDGENAIHIGTPKQVKGGGGGGGGEAVVVSPLSQRQHQHQPIEDNDNSNKNANDDMSLEERQKYAFQIKHHMDTLHYPLTETAYTALVRILCKTPHPQQLSQAWALVKEAQNTHQCKVKLRLYSDLLCVYCQQSNMEQALEVWKAILHQKLCITEKEMVALLECASKVKNPHIFSYVLHELAEDVLVPSKQTTRAIVSWFESSSSSSSSSHAITTATTTESTTSESVVQQQHQQQQLLPPVPLSQDTVTTNNNTATHLGPLQLVEAESSSKTKTAAATTTRSWSISYGCRIDPHTGIFQTGCAQGQKLQPVTLSPDAWKQMLRMNESIVLDQQPQQQQPQPQGSSNNDDRGAPTYLGGGKGKKRKVEAKHLAKRRFHWSTFLNFCQDKQYDIILDGANIGYYQKNFAHAPKHVDYQQIDWIVQHFQKKNRTVLLVLHERHFASHMVPDWAKPIVAKWNTTTSHPTSSSSSKLPLLYKTPKGCNDDWFWLHAALLSGPHTNTLVVTNDEMRDHHFQMLSQRHFLRWKERHQVHFSFGSWSSSTNSRPPLLQYPDIYSRRLQRLTTTILTNEQKVVKEPQEESQNNNNNNNNHDCHRRYGALVIPLPKQGDTHRFLDGMHVADESTPKEETYVCIQAV